MNTKRITILFALAFLALMTLLALMLIINFLKQDFVHWAYRKYTKISSPAIILPKGNTSWIYLALAFPLVGLILLIAARVALVNKKIKFKAIPLIILIIALLSFLILQLVPSSIGGINKFPITFFGNVDPDVIKAINQHWITSYQVMVLTLNIIVITLIATLLLSMTWVLIDVLQQEKKIKPPVTKLNAIK